ncbi:MAG: fibronectin type III domain-containing protein [Candidatus Hydrogenedentota bacterium]
MYCKRFSLAILCAVWLALPAVAHVGDHPSIHNVMASVVDRLRDNLDPEELRKIEVDTVMEHITEDELHVLGTEYVSFTVDKPVTVYVLRHEGQREEPFWLSARGFEKTELEIQTNKRAFVAWKKSFPAGRIGLGVSGFRPHAYPYFAILKPEDGGDLEVSDIYPGQHRAITAKSESFVYSDELELRIDTLPDVLAGQTLITGIEDRVEDTQLVNIFRNTDYPAGVQPDQIVLTWAGNPKDTQTVQWRTSTEVEDGYVQYQSQSVPANRIRQVKARRHEIEDAFLANDPLNHRYTATLHGLKPGVTYRYRVGSRERDTWSDWAAFTTAPRDTEPFSFVYMGDAQNGLDTWGTLVNKAFDEHPEAAFYVMAGDLVNKGNDRDDWDSFFANAAGIYDRRQLLPAIGNHECQGDEGPWMYLSIFDLPENGPVDIPEERAYAVSYSNALFLVLDSNMPAHRQTDWIEEQLSNTDATWKFVVYHHPAYSSGPSRNNPLIRRYWGELFEKYHVDLALQGHDHAYLRTYPMRDEERVDSPAEGTIYIVSVAGTKMYDQGDFDYTEVGFTNVSTYQVLDITIDGDKLVYKAYDNEGAIRDEFVIEK